MDGQIDKSWVVLLSKNRCNLFNQMTQLFRVFVKDLFLVRVDLRLREKKRSLLFIFVNHD